MGVMDRVMFWKKKEDFSFDKGLGSPFESPMPPGQPPGSYSGIQGLGTAPGSQGLGTTSGEHLGFSDSGMPSQDFMAPTLEAIPGQRPMPTLEPVRQEPKPEFGTGRDHVAKELEIVSAKLDTIRAAIESLNVRVSNIERVMQSEYETKQARW